ncbi:MAG: hypothetical protein KDD53_02355, partial [Bdellovibrionales bacterium]|nr:hypothetical protein [Bdellovibrionales bacterium]
MAAIFFGLVAMLTKVNEDLNVVYLHPSLVFGIVFMGLAILLLFSNSVSALGLLFLGSDLDLLIASPVSRIRFFIGKICEVYGSSTWMVFVFGLPVIVAFGYYYSAPFLYYIHALLILFPFFLIPSAIAVIAVTIFTTIVPAHRTREMFVFMGGIAVISFYFIYKTLLTKGSGTFSSV